MPEVLGPKAFSYESLAESDAIRLLLLKPGLPGEAICCSLIHTTISECRENIYEQYTALSYVWGDAENVSSILVHSRPFQITANLAAALDDLRDEHKPLRLWADAICIDQNNILERNHQIRHMQEIFALAQQTVVYLGRATSHSSYVLGNLHHWWKNGAEEIFSSTKNEVRKTAATELLSRAWFSRVWTYQELVLSKEVWVQCGRHRIKWDIFCSILLEQDNRFIFTSKIQRNAQLRQAMSPSFQLLSQMRDARLKYMLSLLSDTDPEPLLSILLSRRGFGVTNPRDMVYGHLAVAGLHRPAIEAARAPVPQVDYNKTVAEVFTDATFYIINSTRSNKVLFHAEVVNGPHRRTDLPSWVPDWSLDSTHHPPQIQGWPDLPKEFPLGGFDIRARSVFIQQPPLLVYRGWSVGKITKMGIEVSHQEFLNAARVEELKYLTALNSTWLWNLEDRIEQASRRLSLYIEIYSLWQNEFGAIPFPALPTSWEKLLDNIEYQNFWKAAEDMYSRRFRGKEPKIIQEDNAYLDQFLMHQAFRTSGPELVEDSGRKLATLAKGGLVIVPDAALPGDMVYFQPLGNDMHFTVLRPSSRFSHPILDRLNVENMIRQELRAKNQGLVINYYTFIGAGSVGTNNDIKKLISQSIEVEREHIIALY